MKGTEVRDHLTVSIGPGVPADEDLGTFTGHRVGGPTYQVCDTYCQVQASR